MSDIEQTSLFAPLDDGSQIHLRYIAQPNSQGPCVLLVHGAVENGKIFYTHSNKGLAPFLAAQGYRCYVADLRGRGQSKPKIGPGAKYGQTEAICEDIPAMVAHIERHSGAFPEYWLAHSWGGVLMNAALARFEHYRAKIKACVYFGSKRALYNNHPEKLLKGNLIWLMLAPRLAKKYGYLPAKKLKWGSDDETIKSHLQSMHWVKKQPWVDSDDQFDYGKALANVSLPPTLHIAGVKDKALAQVIDIQKFIEESGTGIQTLKVYGRKHGHAHDYGHIDMLTHSKAHQDQFQDVLQWLQQYS